MHDNNTFDLSDSHETRRKSLRRSKAISLASDELETEYSFHRFKLNSKDNSTDDYFVLKVKTRSTSSLATTLISPTTENRSLQNFAETLYSNENGLPDEVEKDSPAILESDQFFNHGSPVIIRRGSGMSNKKSISLPSRVSMCVQQWLDWLVVQPHIGGGCQWCGPMVWSLLPLPTTTLGRTSPDFNYTDECVLLHVALLKSNVSFCRLILFLLTLSSVSIVMPEAGMWHAAWCVCGYDDDFALIACNLPQIMHTYLRASRKKGCQVTPQNCQLTN